jgi:hypothetical protein
MNPGLLGQLLGALMVMFGVAAIWLLVCRFIPYLRRRPRLSYAVAMALVILGGGGLLNAGLVNTAIAATALALLALWWGMRRAERRTNAS